jgi:RHS repeat-associated protein
MNTVFARLGAMLRMNVVVFSKWIVTLLLVLVLPIETKAQTLEIQYFNTYEESQAGCFAKAAALQPIYPACGFSCNWAKDAPADLTTVPADLHQLYRSCGNIFNSSYVGVWAGIYPRTPCAGGNFVGSPGHCEASAPPVNGNLACVTGNMKSNPCNAATGNKFETALDSSGGNNPVTRYYNSQFSFDLGLGFGWTSSVLGKRLFVKGNTVQVLQANGRSELFTCSNGACVGGADTHLAMSQDAMGYTVQINGTGVSERYDLNGRLVSETSGSGQVTGYSYNSNGTLATITGPFGHKLTISWNATNHVASIADGAGNVTNYLYDTNNNLVRANYADGSAKLYHYENSAFPHALTGISDVETNGNTSRYGTYQYDAAGKAVVSEHAAGMQRFGFAYDSETQTTVTDAAGIGEVMTFQNNLGLKSLVARHHLGDGKSFNQILDANNNVVCKQDEEGRVTTFTYNVTNQKMSMTEGLTGSCASPQSTNATRTTAYQYLTPTLDLPTLISSPSVASGQSKTTAIQYSDSRYPMLPTRITQNGFTPSGTAVSRAIALTYNNAGQVIRIDGPRADVSDITQLSYNDCITGSVCGQLSSSTNALGHVTTFDSYDGNGRLLQQTDPNGVRTIYVYDSRGRVASVTQQPPSGGSRVTGYTYTSVGDVASVTFPDGRVLNYVYDAARLLRQVTDNLGNQVRYGYDVRGNRIQEYTYDPSNTLVRQIDLSFDARNRVSAVNAAGSITQTLHDALGNVVQQMDAKNNATANSYDALNRIIQTVNALGGVSGYTYDTQDRLKLISAPNGAATQYSYDDLGNLLQEVSPDRGTTTYTVDSAGNVTSITDARGVTAVYAYDALNRIATVRYGTGGLSGFLSSLVGGTSEDVTFAYDQGDGCTFGIGRVCSVVDASGQTQFGYDAFGNVAIERHTELNVAYTTRYTHDAADRIASMTYPDGRVVSYTRDALGRISAATATVNNTAQTIVSNRTYRADGLLTGETYGNGLTEQRQYDLQGRLVNQAIGAADSRFYVYDANGNLTTEEAATQRGNYLYDPLDRLTQETLVNASLTDTNAFTYDANGNRLSDLKNNGATRPYVYLAGSNRLVKMGAQTLVLDPAGNTLSDRSGNRTFRYNNAGQLAQVTVGGVVRGTYVYNFKRQRTQKTKGAQAFVYHYDINGNLIAETRPDGTPVRAYVWADSQPVAQVQYRGKKQSDVLVYLHTDHLHTPRLATDTTQTVQWRWESEAFGTGRPDNDPDGDDKPTNVRLRMAGQFIDGESGLFYNWNRYYDPKVGRYITSDPIGLKGGLNTYAYVGGNPLRWTDRTGLDAWGGDDSLKGGPSICSYYDQQCEKNGTCGLKDKYSCSAGNCCRSFGDNPRSNCTRKCLIDRDVQVCQYLPEENRSVCRSVAHYSCYTVCGNLGDFGRGPWNNPDCLSAMGAMGGRPWWAFW